MSADDDFTAIWAEATSRMKDKYDFDITRLSNPKNATELIDMLEKRQVAQKLSSEKHKRFYTVLGYVIRPIELVGDLAAEAAGVVFPPSTLCFGAAMYLIEAAKGVAGDLETIIELLSTLQDFTDRLKVYCEGKMSSALRKKLADILMVIVEVFVVGSKIMDSKLYRIKKFGRNLMLGKDKHIQELMARLETLTSHELSLVGAETWSETQILSETMRAEFSSNHMQLSTLNHSIEEIYNRLSQQASLMKDGEKSVRLDHVRTILNYTTTAQDRFDEIKRTRISESGRWIENEKLFQQWLSHKYPILWVSGGPGFGKSFLTSSLIDATRKEHNKQGDAVAYFFFRDKDSQTVSLLQALKDMAYQIAQADKSYADTIAEFDVNDLTSIESAWRCLFSQYYRANGGNHAYIFLDGIDEALVEDRKILFELLVATQKMEALSRLHVVMLGQPQIIDEILEKLEDPMTIYVTRDKNRADLQRYIEHEIARSRALRSVTPSLKLEIRAVLSNKAEGMFEWVRLMLVELNKKSRESTIRDALQQGPRGLNAMLQHVIEAHSRTLEEEDAGDLTEMLTWVAFAREPLTLSELNEILSMKANGSPVINLENKLRETFASFFLLTREDQRTTEELTAIDTEDTGTWHASDPWTTEVAFSHASISDFFRDIEQQSGDAGSTEHSTIRVDVTNAHLLIVCTCLRMICDCQVDPSLQGSSSLLSYSMKFWAEHLSEIDPIAVGIDKKRNIANMLVMMLSDAKVMRRWTWARIASAWSPEFAALLSRWLPFAQDLPQGLGDCIISKSGTPLKLFEGVMRHLAELWLVEYIDLDADGPRCIHEYLQRCTGKEVSRNYRTTVQDVREAAEWARLDKTADWYRRVAIITRANGWFAEAEALYEQSLKLDDTLLDVRIGLLILYLQRERFQDAIATGLRTIEQQQTSTDKADVTRSEALQNVHRVISASFEALSIRTTGNCAKKARLLESAIVHAKQACKVFKAFRYLVLDVLDLMFVMCRLQQPDKPLNEGFQSGQTCLEDILEFVHDLSHKHESGKHSYLIQYLLHRPFQRDFILYVGMAADSANELEWLTGKLWDAVAVARKELRTVKLAWLRLTIASLYIQYGDEVYQSQAVELCIAVGTQVPALINGSSEIKNARTIAVNMLGRYYLQAALRDESKAEIYIERMQSIIFEKSYLPETGGVRTVSSHRIAYYLAAWYTKTGRIDDARRILQPLVRDALDVLSGDGK